MEGLELTSSIEPFATLRGSRIFLTGHTGFKGSWLTLLLKRLGCVVSGYALPPITSPSLSTLAGVSNALDRETFGDIRNAELLSKAMDLSRPDIVIHMAAQAFVRRGYEHPVATWDINVMGTVNVLEAARLTDGVKAVLIVATDKCYENQGWVWGYRETDTLGGYDPYSASKAAAELAVQSYRRSFMSKGPLLASVRAGNVIGGGDWSEDRLLADAARAVAHGQPLVIRNPGSTRPWQHVLDCLSGYLMVCARLLSGDSEAATAFNFGPSASDSVPVAELLERLARHWPALRWTVDVPAVASDVHEANYLSLDSSKARKQLGWRPRWPLETTLQKTAQWYDLVGSSQRSAVSETDRQISEYLGS